MAPPQLIESLSTAEFIRLVGRLDQIPAPTRRRMQAELVLAFAQFRSNRRVRDTQIKPNELKKHLRRIASAAEKLEQMLVTHREATDAMARVAFEGNDKPVPVLPFAPPIFLVNAVALTAEGNDKLVPVLPFAPPIFLVYAVEIALIAQETLLHPPKHMPYVDAKRRDTPLDTFLQELLRIWVKFFGEAPTFMGGENLSPFVRLAEACCRYLRLRPSTLGLAKRSARVYAALPEPKIPRRHRPRGPTRSSTGHVVRKM